MLTSPPGYLKRIRELCTKYNVLLIADEVATGFGRTGKMFACQHEGVTPDLMAISKGLTGGYMPLAATLTTDEIYQAFLGKYEDFKTFFHGHSYTGNPLGCAVALANLEVFKKDKTLARLQPKIKTMARLLQPLWQLPHVGDIRQRGIHGGHRVGGGSHHTQPLSPRSSNGPSSSNGRAPPRALALRPIGNVMILMPPLSTSISGSGAWSKFCEPPSRPLPYCRRPAQGHEARGGVEADDLLCSRNARPQKDGREPPDYPSARRTRTMKRCSFDARSEGQSGDSSGREGVMVQREKQEALAWANGMSRRASGWAVRRLRAVEDQSAPTPSLPYSHDDGPDRP